MSVLDRFLQAVDQYQRRRRAAGFIFAVVKKYLEDDAGRTAALLAYYGFLSLFPLLLVATTIFKLLLYNDTRVSSQIIHGAVAYFPVIGHELTQNVQGYSKTGTALIVGIALSIFGARGVADSTRSGLDHIWQVPYAKRSVFPGSFFRSLCIIVFGGLGLLLVPIVSGYVFGFGHSWLVRLLSLAVTSLTLFGLIVFIISVGSSRPRPLRQIWIGAALATVGLELLQALGGYIMTIELQHLNSLYGTFAFILGLLYWIYLQAQILVCSLELDSVRFFKLWPRGFQPPLTPADERAYQLYAERGIYKIEGSSLR